MKRSNYLFLPILVLVFAPLVMPLGALGNDGDTLPSIDLSGGPAFPLDSHLEAEAIAAGEWKVEQIRKAGELLFHTAYNGEDGIGMSRLPNGTRLHRFSIEPPGGGALTAVSAQSCGGCHNTPVRAAAGFAETNRGINPSRDGMGLVSPRSTSSLFGNGFLQLLAQEMTEDLQAHRDEAAVAARDTPGVAIRRELQAKGVSFGAISATADGEGQVDFDLAGLEGVDPDLVIRPLGWKGNFTTVRVITLGAANNLMGLQAEELAHKFSGGNALADPDGDGVVRELSVGDVTAMVVYGSTQETPQSVGRLAELGEIAPPDDKNAHRIEEGKRLFSSIGCSSCHVPEIRLENTVFEEPTRRGNGFYYSQVLAESDPGYDPDRPLSYDLLTEAEAPRAEAHPEGGAILRLYGDLKRHRMGRNLADANRQPPVVASFAPLKIAGKVVFIEPSEFLTAELWGVGNTGPWMHDARAGTLDEAIFEHGEGDPPAIGSADRSEAQEARDAYLELAAEDREAVVTFLRNLRTYSNESKGD